MRVRFSPFVELDLDVIASFIARHNPVRAQTFVQDIRDEFEVIGRNPYGFRLRTDLTSGIRSAAFGSYIIAFRIVDEEVVEIRRVYHGARRPPKYI